MSVPTAPTSQTTIAGAVPAPRSEADLSAIRPFTVHVPDEQLADLRRRLAATRFPTRELVPDREQGVQLATMQELARYWATDYDSARDVNLVIAPPDGGPPVRFDVRLDGRPPGADAGDDVDDDGSGTVV